jgi:hypothetical protein
VARDAGLYKGLGDDSLTLKEHVLSSFSALGTEKLAPNVLASIYLEEFTDEEILQELRWLLPRWREQKGIKSRKTSKSRIGQKTFVRIIERRLIPLLDLMLWGRRELVSITNAELAYKLFDGSDGEIKGEEHLKKVIQPFLREAMTNLFIRDLRHYLDCQPHLDSRLVKDHIQIMEGQ